MPGRVRKWALWITAGTAGVILLASAALLIMLMSGPVSLSMIAPRLQAMINDGLKGIALEFSDATLDWSSDSDFVGVALKDLKVRDKSGAMMAQAPRVEMSLSVSALLDGRAVPRHVTLIKPKAQIVRGTDGQLRFELGRPAQSGQAAAVAEPQSTAQSAGGADTAARSFLDILFDAVQGKGGEDNLVRHLESFSIAGADVTVVDEATGTRLHAPAAKVLVKREANGALKGTAELGIELAPGKVWTVEADAKLQKGSKAVLVSASVTDVTLSDLSYAGPAMAAFKTWAIPVNGHVALTLQDGGIAGPVAIAVSAREGTLLPTHVDQPATVTAPMALEATFDPLSGEGSLTSLTIDGVAAKGDFALLRPADAQAPHVRFNLTADNLSFNWPQMFDRPVALDHAAFAGEVDTGTSVLTIESVALRKGAFEFALSGTFTPGDVSPGLQMTGSFKDLNFDDLQMLWVRDMAPNAHEWMAYHVKEGTLRNGKIAINLAPNTVIDGLVPDEGVLMTFDYDGLHSTYLDGMTAFTQGKGRAVLKGDTFDAFIDSANVGPLKVTQGHVHIPKLHTVGTLAEIKGTIAGTMTAILNELDMPRLGYPSRFGVKPTSVGGSAVLAAHFKVPTLKDVSIEQIDIQVTGTTQNLAMRLNERLNLTHANLDVLVTQSGLSAKGDTKVNGVNTYARWSENFKAVDKPSTEIAFEGIFGAPERAAFGLNFEPYVEETVTVSGTLQGRGADLKTGRMVLDLTRSYVKVPELNWIKPQGVALKVTSDVFPKPNGVFLLERMVAEGQGVSAKGSLVVGPKGIREANLPDVILGTANDFALIAKMPEAGEHTISINGRTLDAAALIDQMSDNSGGRKKPKIARRIAAKLDTVMLKDQTALTAVDFQIAHDGTYTREFALRGGIPGGGVITGSLKNLPDGGRRVSVEASNAGPVLRGLVGFRSLIGGELVLVADMAPIPDASRTNLPEPAIPAMAAGKGMDAPSKFAGALRLQNFRVVDQPFLARLFAAGSFGGLGDLLGGEGITFTRLEHSFQGEGDRITVLDGRASGPAIGVTYQGRVDRSRDKVDMAGTLVPIYGLNSMFEGIPLVGDILTSRKGEGIFGITYQVAGGLDNLDVLVNPLSVVTPGIFRRIFQAGQYPQDEAPRGKARNASPDPAVTGFTPPALP